MALREHVLANVTVSKDVRGTVVTDSIKFIVSANATLVDENYAGSNFHEYETTVGRGRR